jgi:predicted neutral ceramidase superfamily lipid hydrolase
MKFITKNLVIFTLLLTFTTVIFRYFLSLTLSLKFFSEVWIIAALYGVIIFAFGWIFGKKDRISLPLYDIGFRFHLTTYLICNTVAEFWYLIGFQSEYENIKNVHLTALFWGIGILLHFVFYLTTRKDSITGLKKDDIFE